MKCIKKLRNHFYRNRFGGKTDKVELDKLLSQIRKDDTLVVYKLDRLGRSLKHLLELVTQFNEKQIGLQSEYSDEIGSSSILVKSIW